MGLRTPIIPIILGEGLKNVRPVVETLDLHVLGHVGRSRVSTAGWQWFVPARSFDAEARPSLVPGVARAYHQRGGTWSDRHLTLRAPPGKGARPCKFDLAIYSAQFRPSVRSKTD
jgi:hypothetical protein